MIDEYILDKALGKVKNLQALNNLTIQILIEKEDKLADDFTFKNVMLLTCDIKNYDNVYRQVCLEPALVYQN